MAFVNGTLAVTSSAQAIWPTSGPRHEKTYVLIENYGATDVFIGDSAVTTSGSKRGVKIAAGASARVVISATEVVYIVAQTSGTVSFAGGSE